MRATHPNTLDGATCPVTVAAAIRLSVSRTGRVQGLQVLGHVSMQHTL